MKKSLLIVSLTALGLIACSESSDTTTSTVAPEIAKSTPALVEEQQATSVKEKAVEKVVAVKEQAVEKAQEVKEQTADKVDAVKDSATDKLKDLKDKY